MAKQTKQRTVKYPPNQGNLSRKEVERVVKDVVDAGRKHREPKHSMHTGIEHVDTVVDHRFKDIAEKVEQLTLSQAVKDNVLSSILCLIKEIDSNDLCWVEPCIHTCYSEYIGIHWNMGSKNLYLNVDADDQWWSRNWEAGDKIKTGFDDVDYDNLLIHWKWLIEVPYEDQKLQS